MANKNLNTAKIAKKDEFYTQLADIERELQHYWSKVVWCNYALFLWQLVFVQ